MGVDYSTLHAGVLLEQLPEGSRVHRAIDPDNVWTLDRQLLAALVNAVNWLVWSKTKDGQRGRNKPKPIGLPAKKPQSTGEKKVAGKPMDRDEFMAQLARIHGKREGE